MTTAQQPRIFADYLFALRVSYEEEVSGETYFERLASFHSGRARAALLLLAEVERATAVAILPLVERHHITTKDQSMLRVEGRRAADARRDVTWTAMLDDMVTNFPAYVVEFEQIELIAPAADLALLRVLTAHEVAAVDFAKLETAGDSASFKPLLDYLATCNALAT